MTPIISIARTASRTARIPDASVLGEFFSLALAQQPAIIEDIVEVRIALERQAARLACTRATADDLQRLARSLDTIVSTIDDPRSGGEADFLFHADIVAAAHSPALTTVYGTIAHLLERSHLERRQRIVAAANARTFLIDHHRKIFEAIRAGDARRLDDLMLSHFAIGAALHRQAEAIPD